MQRITQLQTWVAEDWTKRSGGMPQTEEALLYVPEELGEVAECLRIAKRAKPHSTCHANALSGELADVCISLVTLACVCNVDLANALADAKKKIEKRHATAG